MEQIENSMVAGLGRVYARQDRADDLAAAAFEALRDELSSALTNDPTVIVQTPAFCTRTSPAFDVVLDSFSGKAGEASLIELLAIVGAAARGEDCQLRACAWIAAESTGHADFHADDLAELLA